MKAIKLICNKESRFRVGSLDISHTTELIHSDTLFSSIINAINMLYGKDKAGEFVNLFKTGDIKISSAFYLLELYKENKLESRIFLLPKVFGRIRPKEIDADSINKKKIKKLKFLSLDVFSELLNSLEESDDGIVFTNNLDNHPTLGEQFMITENEARRLKEIGFDSFESLKLFEIVENPKVSINGKELYYQFDVSLNFEKKSSNELRTHFYFLYDSKLDSENEKTLLSALRLLGDEGIGGKRTTGAGLFEGIDILDFKWELKGKYQTNLSLISPIEDDLNGIYSYDSIIRGGWIYFRKDTRVRKKKVRMIKEGSIFKSDMKGCLVEVGEFQNIKVYQNGINFGLNFEGEQ